MSSTSSSQSSRCSEASRRATTGCVSVPLSLSVVAAPATAARTTGVVDDGRAEVLEALALSWSSTSSSLSAVRGGLADCLTATVAVASVGTAACVACVTLASSCSRSVSDCSRATYSKSTCHQCVRDRDAPSSLAERHERSTGRTRTQRTYAVLGIHSVADARGHLRQLLAEPVQVLSDHQHDHT